jgi:MFS family permease
VRSSLRPLKRPVFALFWLAGLISDAGTWMQLLTIGTLVASTNDSALAVGLVAAATFAPQGLAAPIGGILADRFDRRKLFLIFLSAQSIITFVLAIALASGERRPLILSAIVLLQSASGSLGAPAFQSILPDLVPRDELLAASSLGLLAWNTGRVLGPLLSAGLSWAGAGPAWAVTANGVSFLVLAMAVGSVRRRFPPAAQTTPNWRREMREGFRALRTTPGCRFAVLTLVFLHFTVVPFMGLVPHMAVKVLNQKREFANALAAVQGVGAIVGALSITPLVLRYGRSIMMRRVFVVLGAASVVYVTSTSAIQAFVGILVLGGACTMTFSMLGGMNQRDAPAAQRGRVFSLYNAIMGTTYGLGTYMFGTLTDRYGIRPAFLIGSGFVIALGLFIRARPRLSHIVDHDDPLPTIRHTSTLGLPAQPSS